MGLKIHCVWLLLTGTTAVRDLQGRGLTEESIPVKHFQNDMWRRKHMTEQQRLESIRFTIGLLVTALIIGVAAYFSIFPNPFWR